MTLDLSVAWKRARNTFRIQIENNEEKQNNHKQTKKKKKDEKTKAYYVYVGGVRNCRKQKKRTQTKKQTNYIENDLKYF